MPPKLPSLTPQETPRRNSDPGPGPGKIDRSNASWSDYSASPLSGTEASPAPRTSGKHAMVASVYVESGQPITAPQHAQDVRALLAENNRLRDQLSKQANENVELGMAAQDTSRRNDELRTRNKKLVFQLQAYEAKVVALEEEIIALRQVIAHQRLTPSAPVSNMASVARSSMYHRPLPDNRQPQPFPTKEAVPPPKHTSFSYQPPHRRK